MKKEKGVTMVSLVIYVVVMTIAISIMSSIVTNFYENIDTVQVDVQEVVQFSKFNNYFLKEIKSDNNKVEKISDENDYILFTSGNAFSIFDNDIYFNNIKVCKNVKSIQINFGKDGDGIDKSIINIKLSFEKFNKSMNYKIENIY